MNGSHGTVRTSARRYVAIGLLSACAAAAACNGFGSRSGAAVAADTMTNALVRLRTEQLTSDDVYGLAIAINCETTRLLSNVGYDSFGVLMDVAERRVASVSTEAQRRRIEDSLALKVISAGAGCDSLAAAGRLGGPYLALPYDSLPRGTSK